MSWEAEPIDYDETQDDVVLNAGDVDGPIIVAASSLTEGDAQVRAGQETREHAVSPPAPSVSSWEGLNPPYRTIVADPPWEYRSGGPRSGGGWPGVDGIPISTPRYSMMTAAEVERLPVSTLADMDAHLYLWTTNRYLRDSFGIAEAWGFRHSQLITWCKSSRGIGPGGAFSNTTEFVLFCRRGSLPHSARFDRTWWEWPRRGHSVKPPEFMDIVEQVSPGPRVELFARQPRLGWDSWGYGYESAVPA